MWVIATSNENEAYDTVGRDTAPQLYILTYLQWHVCNDHTHIYDGIYKEI